MLENQLPLCFCVVLAYPRGARFTTGEPCGIQKWYQGEAYFHHAARSAEEQHGLGGNRVALSNFLTSQSIYHGYNIIYMYVCILYIENHNDAKKTHTIYIHISITVRYHIIYIYDIICIL